MCSTRSACVFATKLALPLILLVGCQRIVPPPIASPVNNAPLAADPAMQTRNADQSVCYYANGATIAGGTGYLWQTHETIAPGWRRYSDVPVAVANILSMPMGIVIE